MRRTRGVSPEEERLWAQAMRNVEPLPGRSAPALPEPPPALPGPPPAAAVPLEATATQLHPGPRPPTRRLDPRRPVDIDRRNWERLRKGEMRISARIDLHGLTQTGAHTQLMRFLETARQDGARCVLVITGRGSAGGGILREMTPRWLHEPPIEAHVLAYTQAQPRHGGAGALYVLLRRDRRD